MLYTIFNNLRAARVNRILGPEEDLTDILGKSLRREDNREQSCRVRLARLHLEKIRVCGMGFLNQAAEK
jgi:hypothetical protein